MGEEYIRNTNVLSTLPHLGNLIYVNDFSQGLQMESTGTEADFETSITNNSSCIGGFSAYMRTNYLNKAAGDFVLLQKKLPLPPSPLICLDSTFMYIGSLGLAGISFDLEYYNKTSIISARIQHSHSDKKWAIEVSDSMFSNIDLPLCPLTRWYWHHVRIEMDFQNEIFLKLISDNQIIKTFNYGMWKFEDAVDSGLVLKIWLTTSGDQRPIALIDNILLSSIR